jgi:hypothetical protein
MPAIDLNLTTMSALPLSPREERAGREPERGAIPPNAPPLPAPLLRCAEEREKTTMSFTPKRVTMNGIFLSTLNPQPSTN